MSDERPSPSRRSLAWAIAGVAVSLPLALGLESLLRRFVLPPSFAELRLVLAPWVTAVAWGCVAVALPIDLVALALHRRLWARAGVAGAEATAAHWQRFEGLMIAASVAQLPGLLAVFLSLLGAALAPVLWSLALSTLGVLAIGWTLRRS